MCSGFRVARRPDRRRSCIFRSLLRWRQGRRRSIGRKPTWWIPLLCMGAVACRQLDGCAIVVIRLLDVDAELGLGCRTDRAVIKPDPVLSRGVVAMEELQLLPAD